MIDNMDVYDNTLWVEHYRPDTLDGYVGNDHIKSKVKLYIESGDVPHLLLYGPAGTGKTTCAKIITNSIDCDVLYINASDENSVDVVRNKIQGFASTMGFKPYKIVILDEFDYMSQNAQGALRNLMEQFSKTTRFILTCNYIEKVLDPIQSRCQMFEVLPPSKQDVAKRLHQILTTEGVEFQMEDLATLVNNGYPDIRRVLNGAQRHVINGKLVIDEQSLVEANYVVKLIEILKGNSSNKFTEIRQLIADSKVRDFQQLYRALFDQVDEYGSKDVSGVLLQIAKYQNWDSQVVDSEINVMALMVEILSLI